MDVQRNARRVMAGVVAVVAGAVSAGPALAADAPGLLGQWRFDEGAGQVAVDDGPQRLDGRLGVAEGEDASDPLRIAGASGGALRFDGDSVVRLPDSSGLAVQALTAEAVVRADGSPGTFRYLVSRGGKGCVAGSYGLYTGAEGGIALYVFDGSAYVVSAMVRPADVWNGAWHHVAGTFDGRALRLFLDGRPVGEPMDAPLRIDYSTTSPQASFGQYAGDCNLSFSGDLDLVRLWSGVRSDAAIGETATSTVGAPSGSRPVPAAAPGTVIVSPAPRGCVVRVVRSRARARRPTLVRVRVTNRTRPLRAARVVARRASSRGLLASARTNRAGRARLALPRRRAKRVRISVRGRPWCRPALIGAQS
jgi:hypothetical protein